LTLWLVHELLKFQRDRVVAITKNLFGTLKILCYGSGQIVSLKCRVLLQCCKAGIIHTSQTQLCNARLICVDACMTGVSLSVIHHTATCDFFVLQSCSVLCSHQATRAIILIKNCITTVNKLMQSSICDCGVIYYNTSLWNLVTVESKWFVLEWVCAV
jgi:hypothetical protein